MYNDFYTNNVRSGLILLGLYIERQGQTIWLARIGQIFQWMVFAP